MKIFRACSFCLVLLLFATRVWATDVGYYGIIKSASYHQTPTNTPTILSSNGYMFNAFVIASSNSVLTNATLRLSTGVTNILLPETNDMAWRYTAFFNSQTNLDNAYPAGSIFSQTTYAMNMYTVNDGLRSGTLDFWLVVVKLSYPAIPQISNLAAGQSIDTTTEFTLTWAPLGGSALDIVQVTVMDMASNVVFLSPLPLTSNALNGSSTSIVIPANTLPPGTNLQAHLSIASPDLPNTNYAVGVSALARDTAFELVTRPAPAQPRLEVLSARPELSLGFDVETNRSYHLQRSQDWTNWAEVLVTNPVAATVIYWEADPINTALNRFYRVRVGP